MTYSFSSLDELGSGPGFRKVRGALGVTAFGVNGVVYPPGFPGVHHYHDTQDELYFVHKGLARVEVGGEERLLEAGGLFHVESTTPRKISNAGDDELVLLVIGGKGGYVERDGHVMSDEDLKLRQSLGAGAGSDGAGEERKERS
jgi:quercetin dioxygenase-like cupin family protein